MKPLAIIPVFRTCTKCAFTGPQEAFATGKNRARCKPCISAINKAYRAANAERLKAHKQEYWRKNRERFTEKNAAKSRAWAIANRDRTRANRRAWNAANRDKLRAQSRAQHAKHREKRRLASLSYQKAHPELFRDASRRRRAIRAKAPGSHFTEAEFAALKAAYLDACACCRKPEWLAGLLEADHIIPLTKGGSDSLDNIQPLCRSCNHSKFTGKTDYRATFKGSLCLV